MKSYNCKTLVFWMSHETNVKMDYLLRIMMANIQHYHKSILHKYDKVFILLCTRKYYKLTTNYIGRMSN